MGQYGLPISKKLYVKNILGHQTYKMCALSIGHLMTHSVENDTTKKKQFVYKTSLLAEVSDLTERGTYL